MNVYKNFDKNMLSFNSGVFYHCIVNQSICRSVCEE